MDKGKVTLRKIIKSAKEEWDEVQGWYDEAHEEVFATLLLQLKQLEERIVDIGLKAKKHDFCIDQVESAYYRGEKNVCSEILGKE